MKLRKNHIEEKELKTKKIRKKATKENRKVKVNL